MGGRMYPESVKSINWFVGCHHGCIYCEPSFQKLMMRQACKLCKDYVPHAHLERLLKTPPKTREKGFVFFPSCGDPCFADIAEWDAAILYAERHPETTFIIQSKNPACFLPLSYPDNVILGTTIETNLRSFLHKPTNHIVCYRNISRAPYPDIRAECLRRVKHKRKFVTIEPIMHFDVDGLVRLIEPIEPEFVYVGYDNHKCWLPEPPLDAVKTLIERLEEFTEVRAKTLRKAWWE